MTARAVTIVDALKTQLLTNANLTSWITSARMYTFRDLFSIIDSNPTYPYMVIDVLDVRSGDADNIRQADVLRQTFPVLIYFFCSSLDEETVKRGALTSTPAVAGIFDIYDEVINVLRLKPSLGDAVRYAAGQPAFSCSVSREKAGENWIGGGLVVREFYIDISKY